MLVDFIRWPLRSQAESVPVHRRREDI